MQTRETWQAAFQLRPSVPFALNDRTTEAKNIITGLTSPDLAQGDDSVSYAQKHI